MNKFGLCIVPALLLCMNLAHALTHKKECALLVDKVQSEILDHNKGLHLDAEQGSSDPYWNRLSKALNAVDQKTLVALMTPPAGMKLREFYDALFWGVKSGEIKTTPRQERFVIELRDFVNEYGKLFEDQTRDKAFHILDALKRADLAHNFSGDSTAAARASIRAIESGEESILARALAESLKGKKFDNSKWYDSMYRFFSPHYHRVQHILAHTDTLRARMQQDQIADRPVTDAIAVNGARFNDNELSKIRDLLADTPGKLLEARKATEAIYGRELSVSEPAKADEFRLQTVEKNLSTNENVDHHFNESVRDSERDMDVIDDVIHTARNRAKEGERPWSEYHVDHLRIRHTQHKRETVELSNDYYGITERNPRNPDYDVDASRTVTEHWTTLESETYTMTDAKGNSSTRTRMVTKHHYDSWNQSITAVVKARYEEVLLGRFSPRASETENQFHAASRRHGGSLSYSSASIDSVIPGKSDAILKKGAGARAYETPIRQEINNAETQMNNIIDRYQAALETPETHQALLQEFDDLKAKLQNTWNSKIRDYAQIGAADITSKWSEDKVSDFKDRNNKLSERYLHMVKRVEHFREQANRKEPQLEIKYESPDYSAQLEQLRKVYVRNRVIQWGTGALGVLAGGYYWYNHDDNEDKIEEKYHEMERSFEWESPDENRSESRDYRVPAPYESDSYDYR